MNYALLVLILTARIPWVLALGSVKDMTTGIIYNKESKKMTIEEIEKELGYKIELIQ